MKKVKSQLLKEADKKYQKFSQSLIPNIDNVLGVRLPILRKIAKNIENYEEILSYTDFEFMEEVMIQGMVIGLLKDKPEKILEHIKNFVPKIDNWSVCDCFCGGLKFTNKNPELIWDFLQPYFKSKKEYDKRFGFVMLLTYFINDNYIDKVLKLIDEFQDDRYYARMAVAWALSICYVKYPEKTYFYLLKSNLDNWTYNKSLQKICESLRIEKSEKEKIKKLRR